MEYDSADRKSRLADKLFLWTLFGALCISGLSHIKGGDSRLEEAMRTTHPKQGLFLCPFPCSKGDFAIDKDTLDKFVDVAARLPTFQLWAFRETINHWEIMAELSQPLGTRIERMRDTPDARYAEDACMLARALYLRSQPPPTYQRAWQEGLVNPSLVVDSRVRGLLYALLATERLQIDLGHVLTANQPFLGDRLDTKEVLEQAVHLFPAHFYSMAATALATGGESSSIRYWLPKKNGMTPRHAEDTLDRSMRAFVASRPAVDHYILPIRERLATATALPAFCLDTDSFRSQYGGGLEEVQRELILDTLVYLLYINNWMDWECARWDETARSAHLGAVEGYSFSMWLSGCRLCAWPLCLLPPVIHECLCGRDCGALARESDGEKDELEEAARKVWELTRDYPIPRSIAMNLIVTRLEYAVVSAQCIGEDGWTFNKNIGTIRTALKHALQDHDGPDEYERVQFLDYLRSKSPYLRGAWTQMEFDRWLSE